jgi:hypothetical protein
MTDQSRRWQRGLAEPGERVLGSAEEELVTVRLIGLPLRLWARASEHHEDLMREFALITLSTSGARWTLPSRLLQLIADVRARYGAGSPDDAATRDAALAAGQETLDLTYRVPAAVREACLSLGSLLDEADEYCRADAYLLTLTTPPATAAFRRWFLGEFVRQIDGEPPYPWSGPTG